MRRALLGLALIALLSLALAACGESSSRLSTMIVVSSMPWQPPEEAHYRILDGNDEIGTGVLRIERQHDDLILTQTFESEEFRDEVVATVDAGTMAPRSVERLIEGPEGPRHWQANYDSQRVVVVQRTDDDERRDELSVPTNSYDSWTDVFLWRTIGFFDGYEATYTDVLSATLVKPDIISQTLEVKGKDTVEVPAGTFEAWRLEIRSSGGKQTAWYSDSRTRPLVRYDNGNLLFELVSID